MKDDMTIEINPSNVSIKNAHYQSATSYYPKANERMMRTSSMKEHKVSTNQKLLPSITNAASKNKVGFINTDERNYSQAFTDRD